jgi:hypothetical protein
MYPLYLFRCGLPGLQACSLVLYLRVFQNGIDGTESIRMFRVEVLGDVVKEEVVPDQSCACHGCLPVPF